MIRRHVFPCFLGISAYVVVGIVAHEAIVGGHIAKEGEFPYQVLLKILGVGSCGAGIIGEKFILTAAHCVVDRDGLIRNRSMFIVTDAKDLKKTDEQATKFEVRKISVPTAFNPYSNTPIDDIAVLKLKKSLKLSFQKHLMKLELPKHEYEDYVGKSAKIAGYGHDWVKTDYINKVVESGSSDSQLQFAEADILNTSECQKGYHNQEISKKQLCARVKQQHDSSKPHGVCVGDSGGPLVIDGSIVVGILSSTPMTCSEKLKAALYTRVSRYLNFIENAMNDKNDEDMYTCSSLSSKNFKCYIE